MILKKALLEYEFYLSTVGILWFLNYFNYIIQNK